MPTQDMSFLVFISSAQLEFEELRRTLKSAIDSETLKFSGKRIMEAVLIEERRGSVIHEEIREALDKCSIYVGIFGQKLSHWTAAEYKYARSKGLPLLIYQFKKRRRGRPSKRERRGRKSQVQQFLDDEVKRLGVFIRGPYYVKEKILDDVMNDLAKEVAKLVKDITDIRSVLYKGTILP